MTPWLERQLASTICIPNYLQPNFMAATLRALVKNSYYRHKIFIIWSDPAADGIPTATDIMLDKDGRHLPITFSSVRDFLTREAGWLDLHGVESFDVTGDLPAWRERYSRGEVYPGKTDPRDGCADVGFKWNVGFQRALETGTEWVIPTWDADHYPCPNWDKPIFDYALKSDRRKEYLVPMHVQPIRVSAAQKQSWDAWRDSPALSCHRLTVPASDSIDPQVVFVTESDLEAYVERARRPGEWVVEKCGERARIHWQPGAMRAREFAATAPTVAQVGGPFSLQGSGLDTEYDDRLGKLGFLKIGFKDSFICHKAFCPEANVT